MARAVSANPASGDRPPISAGPRHSFHLRLLAKYGYIKRADSLDGRSHPWQLVEQRVEWNAAGDDEPAADALNAMLIEREAARQRSFLAA